MTFKLTWTQSKIPLKYKFEQMISHTDILGKLIISVGKITVERKYYHTCSNFHQLKKEADIARAVALSLILSRSATA